LPAPLSRTSASALQRTNALSSAAIICRKKSENAGMRLSKEFHKRIRTKIEDRAESAGNKDCRGKHR
jgi:hypothetical protein